MFRFLIVEDIRDTLSELKSLLCEAFPGANVEIAGTTGQSLKLIETAAANRRAYHVAIIDFKLPSSVGENPEIDTSVCTTIKESMPETFVAHITAYPNDDRVQEHVRTMHTEQIEPASVVLSKSDADYAHKLIDKLKAYLYGRQIREQIDDLFGPNAVQFSPDRPRMSRLNASGSMTHQLAPLCRDIVIHWNDIDDTLKKRIGSIFDVDDESDPIRISLL